MSTDVLPIEKTNGDPRFYNVEHLDAFRARKQQQSMKPTQHSYTFPTSRRTVVFRDTPSPYAIQDYQAEYAADHPEPQPPTVTIPIDDQGATVDEPNYNDQAWQQAHAAWKYERDKYTGEQMLAEILAFCIDPSCLPTEEIEVQKAYHERRGHPVQMSDIEYYVKRMCLRRSEDFSGFINAAMTPLAPTMDQIQKK